jgi:hypothetical protein
MKNELAPLQADKRYRSFNQGHDRDNNRSDPDGENDVVLGKEPSSTLLKRTRFARVGRLVSHGELSFFKTFGEARDMYTLSNFLTSFVVKMGAATAERACAKARYLPHAPRGTSLPVRLRARSSAPQSRDHQSRSTPANADAPADQALALQLRIQADGRGRVRRLDVGRGAPLGGPDHDRLGLSERRRHASGWRKKARC